MNQLPKLAMLLLFGLLAACTTRSPHTRALTSEPELTDRTATRLISVWEQQLGQYVRQEGNGNLAVLSQMRVARSRDLPRPARITFGVLDVESAVPGRDGWDVKGVLVGKQTIGARDWYLFVVGIVARTGYRPAYLSGIRVVGVSAKDGQLAWAIGPGDPEVAQRYRDTFRGSLPVQFPADTDTYGMKLLGERVLIREIRSGAEWSLRLGTEIPA